MPARINNSYHSRAFGTGYGIFGEEVDRAMTDLGVTNLGHIIDPTVTHADRSMEAKELAPVALWCSTPPHVRGWYKGQLGVIFTMWESTEIPPGFRENLGDMDRVFVPSLQNLELFSNLHKDVRYVPLGVNPAMWHYRERPELRSEFFFLTSGAGPRKNTDMVVRAFTRTFADHIRGRIRGPIPRLIVQAKDAPLGNNVLPVRQQLTERQIVELYAKAHCYVTATKGEGWGLMPNQAIAQGCPTILPNSSGMEPFAPFGIAIPTKLAPAGHHTFWGDGGEWWEPDFDSLCQAMWDVYHNYDARVEEARGNSKLCLDAFNWERTAEQLIFHLPELWGEAPSAWDWVPTNRRLFRIVVKSAWGYTINGVAHKYEPGVEYWDTADMKMRLGADGKLAPECIDPHEFGRVVTKEWEEASKTPHCPTCGQEIPERVNI